MIWVISFFILCAVVFYVWARLETSNYPDPNAEGDYLSRREALRFGAENDLI